MEKAYDAKVKALEASYNGQMRGFDKLTGNLKKEVMNETNYKLLMLASCLGNETLSIRKEWGQEVRKFKGKKTKNYVIWIEVVLPNEDETNNEHIVIAFASPTLGCLQSHGFRFFQYESSHPFLEMNMPSFDSAKKKEFIPFDQNEEDFFYLELHSTHLIFKIGSLCKTLHYNNKYDIFNNKINVNLKKYYNAGWTTEGVEYYE